MHGTARVGGRGRSALLGLSALALLLAGCGDAPLAPGDVLSQSAESAHFAYRFSAGDSVDILNQERHYAWAMARLQLSYPGLLEYRKYRDVQHLERVTGKQTHGFAEPDKARFHTVWPWDNHEYIHVVWGTAVGESPGLFNEGVAVAHHGASVQGDFEGDPLWNGSSAHDQVAAMLAQGTLPDLPEAAVNDSFRKMDDVRSYAIAGSFVRFLIDEAGMAAFKAFIGRVQRGDDFAAIEGAFTTAYGSGLEGWWAEWRAFLTSR